MTEYKLLSVEAPEVLVIAASLQHTSMDFEGTISMPASYMYILSSMLLAYAERYEDYIQDPRIDVAKMSDLLSDGGMTKH